MKTHDRFWHGSKGGVEYTYFCDGFERGMEYSERLIDNLLSATKYTKDAELIRSLIVKTKTMFDDEQLGDGK